MRDLELTRFSTQITLVSQHLPLKCESINYAPLKRNIFHPHACIVVYKYLYSLSALQRDTPPDHHARKTFDTRSMSFTQTTTLIPLIGHHEGETFTLGQTFTWKWKTHPNMWERHQIFTKNLKVIGVWVISLINCSTSTILSNVRLKAHIYFSIQLTLILNSFSS